MAERIDPEILADLPEPQGVCLSPDGKFVVYLARPSLIRKSEHIQAALWLAEVGKEDSARQITQGDFNDNSAQFSPDGKYISFLSDRINPGKPSILYLLPLQGGEAFALTSKDNEMGISQYKWRPDGKAVAFISPDEKSEERKQREKDKRDQKVYDEDVDYGRLRIIDIHTKEVETMQSVQRNGTQIAWSEDGSRIVYATTKSPGLDEYLTGTKLHLVHVNDDESDELLDWPAHVEHLCFQRETILFLAGYVRGCWTTATCVYSLSLDEANKEPHRLAHGEIDDVSGMKLRNGKIVLQVQHGLTDILEVLDGAELYRGKCKVSNWDVHFGSSKDTIVMAQGSTSAPPEVYSIVGAERTQLSNHGKHLRDKKIGKAHICEYTHEDGTPIDGFYAVPSALESAFTSKKPQKTVLVVRGGPYGRVTVCWDLLWHWSTFFMSLGYVVLCPNYRGGSSHGHDYANAVNMNASASYQDVVWLVKKGIEEGYIDAEYVAITGWSQGGFMSYLAVTRDDDFHFRAAIPGAGVSDWSTMPLTSDLPKIEAAMSGPAAWQLEEQDFANLQVRKNSPLYFTHNVRTPVLIVHGEQDERTPLEQAVGFYRALKHKDKEVTMVTYPREGHCFPVPWERVHYIDLMERVEKFLEKHMK